MNKGLFSLVCLCLLVFVQSQSFKKIPFQSGRILEGSSMKKATFGTLHPENAAIAVELPKTFREPNKIPDANVTDMVVNFHTSITGFCKDCWNLYNISCDNDACKLDTTRSSFTFETPLFNSWSGARYFDLEVKIKSGEEAVWELSKGFAALFSTRSNSFHSYLPSIGSFGILGLGASGDAKKNFKTENPIFSVKTARSGKGEIIFGNDKSLYSDKSPVALPAGDDWTVEIKKVTLGEYKYENSGSYNLELSFDLNVDGLILSNYFYTYVVNEFRLKHKFELNTTHKAFGRYEYFFSGDIKTLPTLEFYYSDTESLKIPPSVYLRLDPVSNKLALQLESGDSTYHRLNANYKPIIFGNQIMSQFYTLFEVKEGKSTVTLYSTPTNDLSPKSSGGMGGIIIGVIVVGGLAAVGYIFFKNKAASKLAEHLNK